MGGKADLVTPRRLGAGQLEPLAHLAVSIGLDGGVGEVTLTGADPLLRSPHRLGEAAATGLLLEGMAAARIWAERGGGRSAIEIDIADALHALHSTHYLRQSGYRMTVGAEFVPTNGIYECQDGRFIMIEAGPPYAKLERGYLNFFDCGNNRDSLARAIAKFPAEALQEKLSALGLPASVAHSREEWLRHPQGAAIAPMAVIEIERIGPGRPKGPRGAAPYPLSGLRALDFTHVLAGPRSMRCLAQYGAEVLHITSPYHRDTISQNLLVNMGKRSAYLLLSEAGDLQHMKALAASADVFACSYRASVAAKFGLDPVSLAAASDGIVYLSIDAYGHRGPWRERPGFDQNAQVATGFAAAEGGRGRPRFSPVFYLNDELTGYLAAAGVMAALLRRAREGGSYHVKVSLARTAMWVQDLGRIEESVFGPMPESDTYPARLRTVSTVCGAITELEPELRFSAMPRVELSTVQPFGADPPRWTGA